MKSILSCYPFLCEIPPHDLASLDLNALLVPTEEEVIAIERLSEAISKNIVIYKRDYNAQGGHLCRYLRSATLTANELALLQACEKTLTRDCVVVAYEKPLTFTSYGAAPGSPSV